MQTVSSQDRAVDIYDPAAIAFRADLNEHVVADTAGDVHVGLIAEFRAKSGRMGGVFAGSPCCC